MSTVEALGPRQMLVVLANVDTRPKRGWASKHRVLLILATHPTGHRIGVREIAQAAGGMSTATAQRVLTALVEDRVLIRAELGVGTRETTWVIQPDLARWVGVPWLASDHRVVLWEVFHVAPRDTSPGQRRDAMHRDTSGSSVAMPYIATLNPLASRSHASRRKQTPSVAIHGIATLNPDGPQRGSLSGSVVTQTSNSEGATEVGVTVAEGDWRTLRAVVLRAAATKNGTKFLNGPPAADLQRLAGEVGVAQLLEWLTVAPVGLGVPALVDWLGDQRFAPDPEILALIDERLAAEPVPTAATGAPDPTRPHLVEYVPLEESPPDPAIAAEGLRLAREAREARKANPHPIDTPQTPILNEDQEVI